MLAKEKFGLRAREMHELEATFVPFTAQTRMSGVDLHANGTQPTMRVRKGAAEAVRGFVESAGGMFPQSVAKTVDEISHRGGTPLVVASEMMTLGKFRHLPVVEEGRVVGLISIGDIVKRRVEEFEREQEALREYIKTA